MNAKNLPLKFAMVALLVAFCLYSLFAQGLRYGIDLQGGHSLVFEIRTPQAEIDGLRANLAEQQERLEQAKTDEQKKEIQKRIDNLTQDIANLGKPGQGGENLAERMIEILKERIDPQGLANLEWRPVGPNRIEVRMPAAKTETRQRQEAYDAAIRELAASNISRAERRRHLYNTYETPEQKAEFLESLTEKQRKALTDLGEAFAKQQAAQKAYEKAKDSGDQAALQAASKALDEAKLELLAAQRAESQAAIRPSRVVGVLANYRSPREQEGLPDNERIELENQFNKDLAALIQAFPARKALINKVVEAHKAWTKVRHELSTPDDLIRRISRSGVLEFRVVAGEIGEPVTQEQVQEYIELLNDRGPDEALRRGLPFAWFPVRPGDEDGYSGTVRTEYAGRTYMLLSNQAGQKMVRDMTATGGWSLASARKGISPMGGPAIDFTFDEKGASQFYALTAANIGKAMAITLDDEVFSAPRIKAAISSQGQITGRFSDAEVDENVKLLEAGSLPARINPNPVSVRSFGPTLGKENRDAGIRAAYVGMICVAVFMLIYYLFNGAVADVALTLNIILVLGAMSLLSAVFTLPGIAGIILTIGIAVDANVLIFERLREEQSSSGSVQLAIKRAYEKAFTAILDANVTTLLTCLILGWVGTIEVRGFAITLGLGVLFSMFTALVVTRWVYQFLVESKWLGSVPKMMPQLWKWNVNWMRMRHGFWGVSAVLIVLGVAAIVAQGSGILGIEFSSGTQATFQFKTDALIDGQLPNDGIVRRLFAEEAKADPNTRGLADARVEMEVDNQKRQRFLEEYDKDDNGTVSAAELAAGGLSKPWIAQMDSNKDGSLSQDELGNLPALTYQVSSTETNLKLIQRVVREAYGGTLRARVKASFTPLANEKIDALGLTTDIQGIARVEPVAQSLNADLLDEYDGGVAVAVKDVDPAMTVDELRTRISEARAQATDVQDITRPTEVIGLGATTGGAYSRFVVLVDLDEAVASQWGDAAAQQKQIIVDALERDETIVPTSFDPAIAGQATQRAIVAIVLSWVAIVLYLWLRFGGPRWGIAAVICLVHDTLIVLGLVAASGWVYNTTIGQWLGIGWFKIDLAMVAAILTVIGYSVNDTIVVFDRIREQGRGRGMVSVGWINEAINKNMGRTLLTSFTTLIVVLVMFIWGGSGIKGFSFTLLAGVLFGTYSSIVIAAPLLLGFKQAVFAKAENLVAAKVK